MSPQASMIGRASLDWDLEIFFPQPQIDTDLAAAITINDTLYVSSANMMSTQNQQRALIGSSISQGTGASLLVGGIAGATGGVPAYRQQAGAPGDLHGNGFEGVRGIVPTTEGVVALPVGASWPSINRVWWLKILLAYNDLGGGAAGTGSGFLVMPEDDATSGWPTQLVGNLNRGGFGLTGDGAGQWTYSSWDRTGVSLLREAIALPAHNMADYNTAEWVLVGARPGFYAYLEFWFNNALICTRNWMGGLLEPIGGAGPANVNEWGWVPHMFVTNQANTLMTGGVMRAGRFLRDGTEIQG